MIQYEVAELAIDMITNNSYSLNRLKPFLSSHQRKADLKISMKSCESINVPEGRVVLDDSIKWAKKSGSEKGFFGYRCSEKSGEVLSLFDTDNHWGNASVIYPDSIIDGKYDIRFMELFSFHLASILFRNRLLFHDGIVMHASGIEYRGKGIMFSAPSGTGKSTHRRLWETYLGTDVKVLNDDTPAVKLLDGQPYMYGTPWSGSSDKFLNMCTPLSAIIVLEQAPENCICRLSVHEAVVRLMPRSFLPYFDNALMEIAVNTLEKVIAATPVYLLKCKPDREAMEFVYKCVI